MRTSLRIAGGRNRADQGLHPNRRTVGCKALQIDVVGVVVVAVRGPDHGVAAIVGDYLGTVLTARRDCGNERLSPNGLARGIVSLAEDTVAGTIGAGVVLPGYDKATVSQGRDARVRLVAANRGIDKELGTHRDPGRAETLGIDAVRIDTILVVRHPCDHVAAIGKDRNARTVLGSGGKGIDLLFAVNLHFPVPFQLRQKMAEASRFEAMQIQCQKIIQ